MSQNAAQQPSLFSRVIKGTGMTPMQNIASWAVIGAGFAYYYYRQSQKPHPFDVKDQAKWNQSVLEKAKKHPTTVVHNAQEQSLELDQSAKS